MADTSMEVEMTFQGRSGNGHAREDSSLPFKNPTLSKSIVIQSINDVVLNIGDSQQNNSTGAFAKQGYQIMNTDATLARINETSVSDSQDFSNFTKHGGGFQTTGNKGEDLYKELKLS